MKTTIFNVAILSLSIVAGSVSAQNKVKVSVPKFGRQLVQKWAEQYNKENGNVQIVFTSSTDKTADLKFSASDNEDALSVGRYALLGITSSNNPDLSKLTSSNLDEHRLKDLFFEVGIDATDDNKNPYAKQTVYVGIAANGAGSVFAQQFAKEVTDYRGKRIAGDDVYLLQAIANDPQSVTINSIPNLYDYSSRKLKENLVVLPLSIKKEQREILENGSLDDVLSLLEGSNIDLVPVSNFAFTYNANNVEVVKFIAWVISNGQELNHSFGFLKVDEKTAKRETKQLPLSML